jgi:hypothetical protein
MIRIEIPSSWGNWMNQRDVMKPGAMACTFSGMKYPIVLEIVEAGFDVNELRLNVPMQNTDEFAKTYLEFPDENCAALFRLKLSHLWESDVKYDNRNR